MAFRKLIARTGLFSSKEKKPAKTPERKGAKANPNEANTARPLSINVDTALSPEATPVPTASRKLKRGVNRDWFANITRIKSSTYYNRINDIAEVLRLISKSEESDEALTPSERSVIQDFESEQSPFNYLSPRLTGKKFEFLQQPSPLQSNSRPGSGIISDHFTLYFGDGGRPREREIRTDFIVTGHENVVVVESEESFKNAKLFQQLYPDAAKSFGFMRVIWVNPEKPIEEIEVDRSDHPDWAREELNSRRRRRA